MAMGEAKDAHLNTGKRIVFPGDRYMSKGIFWGAAYERLSYIITSRDIQQGEEVVFFENGKEITPYIDWEKSTEKKAQFKKYMPKPAELKFSADTLNYLAELRETLGEFIFIEPHVKELFSAGNKSWGFTNYQEVVNRVDANFVQPYYGAPLLKGVKPVKTNHFLHGAALLSIAKTALLPEGGLMHAAAALNIPSVIVFGGFISPENTGYDIHSNIFKGLEPCGSRTPCMHCRNAMNNISPIQVAKKLNRLFKV